jgi:hypothetical protein
MDLMNYIQIYLFVIISALYTDVYTCTSSQGAIAPLNHSIKSFKYIFNIYVEVLKITQRFSMIGVLGPYNNLYP